MAFVNVMVLQAVVNMDWRDGIIYRAKSVAAVVVPIYILEKPIKKFLYMNELLPTVVVYGSCRLLAPW